MTLRRFGTFALGLCASLAITAAPAQATLIELNSGYGGFIGLTAEGGGRAQGIFALDTFTVDFIGFEAELEPQDYDLIIYDSLNGSDPMGILAQTTGSLGGGFGFHDLAMNFTFNAGAFYIVSFRPTDLGAADWAPQIQYYSDAGLPVDGFPIQLVDGIEGANAEHSFNVLHPNIHYNVVADVPEPSAVALVGLAIGLLAAVRRRS